MKKKFLRSVLIPLLFAVVLGFYGAKIAYGFYQTKRENSKNSYNAYAIQYGVYSSHETMEKNISNLDNYIVSLEDGKYYIYLGFTTDYNNLLKLRQFFEKKDLKVYSKEIFINNPEFLSSLEQFDILLDNANSEEDILSVNDAILSSYNEIIIGN